MRPLLSGLLVVSILGQSCKPLESLEENSETKSPVALIAAATTLVSTIVDGIFKIHNHSDSRDREQEARAGFVRGMVQEIEFQTRHELARRFKMRPQNIVMINTEIPHRLRLLRSQKGNLKFAKNYSFTTGSKTFNYRIYVFEQGTLFRLNDGKIGYENWMVMGKFKRWTSKTTNHEIVRFELR